MTSMRRLTCALLLALTPLALDAQTTPANPVQHALDLAQSGHCPQALAPLQKAFAGHLPSKLRLQVGLQALTCAMALNREQDALQILLPLQKSYPRDPEVLYLATHVYSDLSTLASRSLIFYAPGSYQVHELDAESLEVQGEWQKAEGEYRTVLQMHPNLPGIHYRIGRLLLSEPPSSDQAEQQKRLQAAAAEFDAELKIDPRNAGAEFVLGQLARQAGNWQDAVTHFAHAAKLNPTFTPALIAEGEARIHVKDYWSALKPLQEAERQQPGNPTPHFLLSQVYRHDSNQAAANAEFKMYEQMRQQAQVAKDQLQKTLTRSGQTAPAQK